MLIATEFNINILYNPFMNQYELNTIFLDLIIIIRQINTLDLIIIIRHIDTYQNPLHNNSLK